MRRPLTVLTAVQGTLIWMFVLQTVHFFYCIWGKHFYVFALFFSVFPILSCTFTVAEREVKPSLCPRKHFLVEQKQSAMSKESSEGDDASVTKCQYTIVKVEK